MASEPTRPDEPPETERERALVEAWKKQGDRHAAQAFRDGVYAGLMFGIMIGAGAALLMCYFALPK